MLKRISFLLCVAMLAWLIAGCGGSSVSSEYQSQGDGSKPAATSSDNSGSEPQAIQTKFSYTPEMLAWAADVKSKYGGTTLNMATYAHPAIDSIKTMSTDFEALTGIKIVLNETDLAKSHDRVVLDFTSGKYEYDIITLPEPTATEYIELDYLEKLNDYIAGKKDVPTGEWFDINDISYAYQDLFIKLNTDELYAIPFTGENGVLYYRKDIFDKYGFKVPKTTDEILALATEITNMKIVDDGKTMYGISFRGRPSLGGANWLFQVFAHSFGGQIVDPSDDVTPTVNNQGSVDAAAWLTELCKVGVPGIAAFDPYDAVNQFRNGMAAMCLEASTLCPDSENPEISASAGKIGYAAFPAGPAGSYNTCFAHGLGVSAKSGNKDASWAFIQWMTSRENHITYLQNGGAVNRDSALSNPELAAEYPFFQAILDANVQASALANKGFRPTPKTIVMLQYVNSYAVNISAAFSGEVTPEQAIAKLQTDMEQIANDAGLLS